jgi:hypothetical protein
MRLSFWAKLVDLDDVGVTLQYKLNYAETGDFQLVRLDVD